MEPFVLQKLENGCELFFVKGWMDRYAGLTAGFTSRHGGVSRRQFGSLNCGLHVADAPEDVIHNRRRVAEALNIRLEDCTYAEQVHGNEVQAVTREHAGAGIESREQAIQAKDAFITNETGLFLHALFADCVPLLFFDPVRRAVGLAHAGWKGTVLQIARMTVEAMRERYGTQPEDLLAAIGPSIHSCCYEVDDTVMDRIRAAMNELGVGNEPADGGEAIYRERENRKYSLSLQQMNRQIMIKAGILPSHIEMSSLCTSCRTDLFFSHRKEAGITGRMAAWIGFNE
ncbi:peptidoglycan editing factor PgeF [Paenibacillus doosanensis]|uniref:Purine nucleoside phosphorylase n=1 Tax=Paenibacillus konkukensis TaxID=2020716 RepID=A0ABY4RZ37_9BACL|nr:MULTISPECIES: peptidoglycan editing factor PgeF [Paenibacillus]MCS7459276.1 peptidoglycan editing factor PgeF [Paenibacillus doosanensis]UQZ87070.1 Laccase domain protein [Paenibacillus konkukensis]